MTHALAVILGLLGGYNPSKPMITNGACDLRGSWAS